MSFAIIDQGFKTQTPLRTLFPDKGVDRTSSGARSHTSTDSDLDYQSQANLFRNLLDANPNTVDVSGQTTYDALKPNAKPQAKKPGLIASQIMSTPVHSIPLGTTAHATWEKMQELSISHLMVDDLNGKPIGIVSRKDILPLGVNSTQSITQIYTSKLIAGSPTTEVAQIAACFIEFDINAIPIFDSENTLQGIVCRADLLRLLISGAHIEGWA
ncbi:MAG: HPP family protein [Pseudomonadales bacterium]